jgi:transmembrane sensor
MDLETRLRLQPLPVRDVWTPDKAARLPREVLRRLRRRTMTRVALATSAAAGVLALLTLRLATPSVADLVARHPLRLPALAAHAPRVVSFHDGSRAELDRSTSRLEVSSDRGEHVSLRLMEGGARFDVVPNPKRVFEVEAGPVRVRVIGTAFSMLRTSEGTRVAVERGRVRVIWADHQVELGAGEGGEFPPLPEAQGIPVDSLPLSEPEATEPDSEWRELARKGDYARAYTALRRSTPRQTPEELMLAADVARLSGNPAQAVPHLQTVVQRFSRDPRAPVASFTLGRVYLDNLGRPAEAAAAFRRTRSSWPAGPLAQDAWAREVAAWRRAGQPAEAMRTAREYLERHPKGAHAESMKRLID